MEAILRQGLAALGLPQDAVPQLMQFSDRLLETNKVMNLLMPLMSVVFGFMWPLGLSIYWLAQSAFGIVQDVVLTKHYRKVYDAEDAERQERAAMKRLEEAEKERQRALRRAQNPDGIQDNVSKKKLKQQEKEAAAAATRDYEAKKNPAAASSATTAI